MNPRHKAGVVADVLDDVKSLIGSKSAVDPDKLADPQAPLGGLVS